MRYFLGFDLSLKTKLSIESWRNKALPSFSAPVPAKNFHITSVFLGQIEEQQLERLYVSIEQEQFPLFTLTLDQLGYWAKPKILWLGSTQTSTTAENINQKLTKISLQSGVQIHKQHYVPHVTLVRKSKTNPPSPLIAPNFECEIDQLHMFESVSTKNGVQYPIRRTWKLY